MSKTRRRETPDWGRGFARALAAAGLAVALSGPTAAPAGQAVTVDIGRPPANLIAPGKLIGEWLTIVRVDDKPQPVRLTIHKVEPGKTAGKLIYSSPRRCTVDLEYGGPDGDRHIFYMIPFTNCFDYKKTDYVAIWLAAPDVNPGEGSGADRYGLHGYQRAAKDGADATDAAPTAQAVEQLRYSVVLSDQEAEAGLLTRQ